tara:strand:+ start:98 stop:634 length:537 start_codon:yes stop_codon:yes gene_type:complete
VEIIDDVLEPEVLDNIVQNMTSSRFLWEYQPYLKGPEGDDDKGIYCFTHKYVYNRGEIASKFFFEMAVPILDSLNIKLKEQTIIRADTNFSPNFGKQLKSGYHVDQSFDHKVLIYYYNTCNGGTEFKNGKIVNCVANRAVIFDSDEEDTAHRVLTQTDKKYRLILNVNWEPRLSSVVQ